MGIQKNQHPGKVHYFKSRILVPKNCSYHPERIQIRDDKKHPPLCFGRKLHHFFPLQWRENLGMLSTEGV